MVAGPVRRNARAFVEEVAQSPRCAVLYATEQLLAVASPGRRDIHPSVRPHALAELFVRFLLNPDTRNEQMRKAAGLLAAWMGADRLGRFIVACQSAEEGRGALLDEAKAVLLSGPSTQFGESDVAVLWMAVLPYLQADGVIPVFRQGAGTGYLLPFRFIPRRGDVARVWDGAAVPVPLEEWSRYLGALPEIAQDVQVELPLLADVAFTGDSLMLPLQMAWWRHAHELPGYRPLRFLATGAFRSGRLGGVATEEKARKVADDVQGGFLIRPGESGGRGTLPEGLSPAEALERIRPWAEEACVAEVDYANRRLAAYDQLVRQTNVTDWASLNRRLDNAIGGVRRIVYPDAWLGLQMLRSAARCHAGRTEEAAELNREARAFAARKGKAAYVPLVLRMEIEGLVILQDLEDFAAIFAMVPDLERRLEAFAAEKGDVDLVQDLRMRFYGTMGQILAYAALAGHAAGDADLARTYFDRAYEAAEFLKDHALDVQERCTRIGDMAQDANYRLLWRALFEPSETGPFLAEAEQVCDALRDSAFGKDGLRAASKNDGFRMRAHVFGCYRALLAGQRVDVVPDYGEVARRGYFWIAATTGKYLGALLAAQGEAARAREFLELAERTMAEGRQEEDGAVLRVIHMTVCAEAYRSLRQFAETRNFADEMRRKAVSFFGGATAITGKNEWLDWLRNPDASEFPGFHYWY